jgi:oxalate decarboxylase
LRRLFATLLFHCLFKDGCEWRVDSTRFPISTTITGVILDLEPDALRELRWHPNADEWQYVIEGEIGVTMFWAMDLSAWIAGNPVSVLATNFNRPESLTRTFPRRDVFIAASA